MVSHVIAGENVTLGSCGNFVAYSYFLQCFPLNCVQLIKVNVPA